jgi:hypothetical protein
MIDWEERFEHGMTWEDWLDGVKSSLNDEWHERYENAWLDEGLLGDALEETRFIVCVVSDSCPDSCGSLPFIARAIEDIGHDIELRLFTKKEHPDLMQMLLVDGKESSPAIAIFDEDWSLIGRWGPRPASARELFGKLSGTMSIGDVDIELNRWYRRDAGHEVLSEFLPVLRGIKPASRKNLSLPVYDGDDL